MADDPVEWADKGAFVMPAIQASLGVDPIVAAVLHAVAFFQLSGDDVVDPDCAVEATEYIVHYLARLPAEQLAKFGEQVARVAEIAQADGWGAEAIEFFSSFMENGGLTRGDESADV